MTLIYEVGPERLAINIRVVASEPEGVFDEAAIQAISRWSQSDPLGTPKKETIEFSIDDHSECNSYQFAQLGSGPSGLHRTRIKLRRLA